VQADFPDGQLHLDLRGNQGEGLTPAEALNSLCSKLGLVGLEPTVSTFRSLTAGKRVLVILDNAQSVSQVRPLLPNSARSLS
jgi:hypothetical protein